MTDLTAAHRLDACAILLGTPVDDVTIDEAIDRICWMVRQGRTAGSTHQVVTVNVDFLVNGERDDQLRSVLQRSDLAIPDGMPVVWGARLLRMPLRERTAGADLMPALAGRAARDGLRLCLFGGAPGVAAAAADVLRSRSPALEVTGVEAPTVGVDGSMDPSAIAAIAASRPDVVCVALGNPKQEHWIARHRIAVGAPVFIGIGGTLDFLTGRTRRAPLWMQRAGLEWVHRAVKEPRRLLGRYSRDLGVFVPRILLAAWGARRGGDVGPTTRTSITSSADGNACIVTVRSAASPAGASLRLHDGAESTLIVNVSDLSGGRVADLATVVGIVRSARRMGYAVRVHGADPLLADQLGPFEIDLER